MSRRAPGQPQLVDVNEAASLLSLKPSTLYQWAYQRRVPVVKLLGPRGALRFRVSDLEALIARSVRPALRSDPEPTITPPTGRRKNRGSGRS